MISRRRLASLADGSEGDSRDGGLHGARRDIVLLGAVHCLAFSKMSWCYTATARVDAAEWVGGPRTPHR